MHRVHGTLTLRELRIDLRWLLCGEWVDVEYLLKAALVENDRLRVALAEARQTSALRRIG